MRVDSKLPWLPAKVTKVKKQNQQASGQWPVLNLLHYASPSPPPVIFNQITRDLAILGKLQSNMTSIVYGVEHEAV